MRIRIFFFMVMSTIMINFINTMHSSINIDTRSDDGAAQAAESFVFDSIQTFSSDFDYAYGDVEFRAGIKAITNDDQTISLGITRPLRGALIMGQGLTIANFNVYNDLTLSITAFNGPNTVSSGTQNAFLFNGISPCTIFLDNDLTVNGNTDFSVGSNGANTILDGKNYTIFLTPGSTFSPAQLGGSFTVQNCIIQGITASSYQPGSTNNGHIGFRNVSLIAGIGETIELADTKSRFIGQDNIIGYGGTADFSQVERTSITIATQSQLYIAPDTTLVLNHTSSFNLAAIIAFEDSTSVLFLDNCNLFLGSSNNTNDTIPFLAGTMIINGNVTLTGTYGGTLKLGDGASISNNFNVIILPGSKLIVGDGATLLNENIS